ncbi:MAG: AAA family ATPase [Steroidobacteraceae bacterium]
MSSAASHGWTAEQVARALDKPQRTPTGWKACCPAHEDRNPSLYLADGNRGGIAMVCYAGCSYADIAQALEARGIDLSGGKIDDPRNIPDEHYQLGRPSSSWDYRDATGSVVMRICRWEQPAGKKEIRPIIRTAEGWKWAHHPTPRPLYAQDRLANEPDAEVLVVEGEKAAAAAQRMLPQFVVTTWPGGAQSVGQADWAPLRGRRVTLVPDCDVPGRKAMEWVVRALGQAAASVRVVNPLDHDPTLPEGWDLADAAAAQRDVSGWFTPAEPAPKASRIRWLSDVLENPTQPRWLLRDVLEERVLALLIGGRGSYKSFIALDWGMRTSVAGHQVLFISAEGSGFDRRAKAWLLKHGAGIDPSSLKVALIERRVDLNTVDSIVTLVEEIEAAGLDPALIVVDTLSKNSGGLDENSNSEGKAFLGRLDEALRQRFGCTVLFVHHTGHTEKGRARGASALEADTDAAYIVERQPDSKRVTVTRERFKDSGELPPLAYQAHVIDLGTVDEDGQPITSLALEGLDAETVKIEAKAAQPRGGAQKRLLKVLQELQSKADESSKETGRSDLAWSSGDLRRIAREAGMSKQTAQDAAAALTAFYLIPTVGGYRLRKRGDKTE